MNEVIAKIDYDRFLILFDPIYNNLIRQINMLNQPFGAYLYQTEGIENEVVCSTSLTKIWTVLETISNDDNVSKKIIVNQYIDPKYSKEGRVCGYMISSANHDPKVKYQIEIPE